MFIKQKFVKNVRFKFKIWRVLFDFFIFTHVPLQLFELGGKFFWKLP